MTTGGEDLATPTGGADLSMPVPGVLAVEPSALQTISVVVGQAPPTVVYNATYNGQPVSVAWSVDRGDIGTIPAAPAASVTFTPSAGAGGLVTITASLNNQVLKRQILVKLSATQNGADPKIPAEVAQVPTTVDQLSTGGGVGGVGGEGLGPQVTDAATQKALTTPSGDGSAQGLVYLYPYDGTVWPRGLPAPLLMWRWATNDADAVRIELSTTSGSFSYSGTFGRPAILTQTRGAFLRHPIPQDIWDMAANSAGAVTQAGVLDKLTVKITIAKGGVGYGPISQTWTIAPARLSGTIYYNSYGTRLAQNSGGAVGGNKRFGGAVLSIRVGDSGPKLLAGNDTLCRTCHSVAASGSRLITQNGENYAASTGYTLTPMGATAAALTNDATFSAIYPDGSLALTAAGRLLSLPADNMTLTVTGLSAVATNLGTPAFAPDGTRVAFNPMAGAIGGLGKRLVVMNYAAMTRTFSNPVIVVDESAQAATVRPGWPAFLPDGQSLVFHNQSTAGFDGNNDGALWTRSGAKAQIAWAGITAGGPLTPLDQLNGKDANGKVYLPKLPAAQSLACTADGNTVGTIDADHGDDVNLNYEPTVNPVASGGYAWVVFTSRRMYGSVATIPPFCSDPRGVDLVANVTPKKLWVAAVDLSGKPGKDASHPAFYLPAQEILAGNSRGFWVLDPCRADGASCSTGDQCCNGFCQPNGANGALVCSSGSPNQKCSLVQERCTTPKDCCDARNLCTNGFCAQNTLG